MESLFAYIRRQLQTQYSNDEIKSLASIICSDVLNISVVELHIGKYTDLSADKMNKLQRILDKLRKHEPIQYIIGSTIFCNLKFKVTPAVLIPRPETQELVNLIITENNGKQTILDIGTGSGCIAISLSKQLPQAVVTGWDISPEALQIAQDNNTELKANVYFKQQDIFDSGIETNHSFDIIVSNPPYVTESDKKEMQPEVLEHEPGLALFVPDDDPLLYYRRIAQFAEKALHPQGKIYLEINQNYGEETVELLKEYHFKNIRLIKDFYQNNRIVTATK